MSDVLRLMSVFGEKVESANSVGSRIPYKMTIPMLLILCTFQ